MKQIQKAILDENFDLIKELLEDTPNLIDEVDENGILMSFLAAKTGNLKIVKYIAEYSRASMNIADKENKNILHYGAMSGSVEVCKYLVEKIGMSPTSGDNALLTPYEIATNDKNVELVKYFESVVGAPLDRMYHNPIRTGFYPDPSIVRVENDYYMVNSSFIYFPCIPVSHSTDLVHWHIIGYAITNPEWAMIDELEGGRGYWAPDISYNNGKFYITATYRLNDDGNVYRKQIVVSSDKPEGPYSKPAIIDEDGIDPSIFTDEDGRRYMLLNRGARIFELNQDATKQISEAEMLYYGDNKRAPEGPHILKKDGYYYLFQAEGGTGIGHRISVARSKELKGNYEPCPYNPIMRQTDENAIIQRCGHGKPVLTQNGEWYMVYLCGRKITGKNGESCSILGRETALDPITWTADGWPIVNQLNGPSTLQIKPNLPETIWKENDRIDFAEDDLFSIWTFPRTPEKDGYTIENSKITLKGSKKDLDSMYSKNILLRRQTAFNFTVEAKMEMPKLLVDQDAGLTCYYDENTYLKFGVFCGDDNKPFVQVSEKIGDDVIVQKPIDVKENAEYVLFKIVTKGIEREFFVSFDGENYINAGKLDNVYYLCDEGLRKGKRFTGAMVGMYAHSGEDKEQLYATFQTFKYQNQ